MTPIFGLHQIKRIIPPAWKKALVLHEVIENSVKEAGGAVILHMHELTMATALDIIGVTTVGVDFDSLRYPDQPILKAYQAVFPRSDSQSGVEKFFGAVLPAVVSPHLLFKLPLRPIRRFHWGMEILQKFCVEQIHRKKQEIAENPNANEDIRGKGLASLPETNTTVLTDPETIDILSAIIASGMTDDQELVDHLLTILAAA